MNKLKLFLVLVVGLLIMQNLITGPPLTTAAPTAWEQIIKPRGSGFESTYPGGWVLIRTQNTVHCSTDANNVIYTRTRAVGHTNDVDWARWRPNLPTTAWYDVYGYISDYTHNMNVTGQARYKINHADGQTVVTVNQNNNKCSWVHLGRYRFNAGTSGSVYMGDYTGDNPQRLIAADGMKFVLQSGSISGKVTDSGGGPIAGVTISDGAGHSTTTNSQGHYTLSNLDPGTYTITPSKSNHQFSPASRTVTVPPDATSQNFVDPNRHSISGKVTDGNGNAIADVPVLCQGLTWNTTTKTDSNGNYRFSNLVPGFYQIQAPSGSPYTLTPSRHIVTIRSSSAGGRDFTTTPIYGNLGGRITDKNTGQAVRNARVSVAGRVTHSDSAGNYNLQNVLPGTHPIRVSASNYKNYEGSATVRANQSSQRNVQLEPLRADSYYLPYPNGRRYKCTQGNNGGFSHNRTSSRYAFDFGTRYDTIVASRRGRVVALRRNRTGSCYNGGCSSECLKYGANFVRIRHTDGTETEYAHLSKVYVNSNGMCQGVCHNSCWNLGRKMSVSAAGTSASLRLARGWPTSSDASLCSALDVACAPGSLALAAGSAEKALSS